jgi:hypothetical protein
MHQEYDSNQAPWVPRIEPRLRDSLRDSHHGNPALDVKPLQVVPTTMQRAHDSE